MTKTLNPKLWAQLTRRYPQAIEHFKQWFAKYQEEVNWQILFNNSKRWGPPLGIEDLPDELQKGILDRYDRELTNSGVKDNQDEHHYVRAVDNSEPVITELFQRLQCKITGSSYAPGSREYEFTRPDIAEDFRAGRKEEAMRKIQEMIAESIGQFSDKPIGPHTAKEIYNSIYSLISSRVTPGEQSCIMLDVQPEGDILATGRLTISPKNLFTHLLMQGISVPAWMLEGTTRYKDDKTGITWVYEDGKAGFIPHDGPLERFKFSGDVDLGSFEKEKD
jgi:hypothetical protein